jgi:hypothetical protein
VAYTPLGLEHSANVVLILSATVPRHADRHPSGIPIVICQNILQILFAQDRIIYLTVFQDLNLSVSFKWSLRHHHGREAQTREAFGSGPFDVGGVVAGHDGWHIGVHDHAYDRKHATKSASAQARSTFCSASPCLSY